MSFIPGNIGQPAIAPAGITGTAAAPLSLPSGFTGTGQTASVLPDADKVLLATDNLRVVMAPTATRNVVLPSSGIAQGMQVTVSNNSSTSILNVRVTNVGGTIVKVVPANSYMTFVALIATPSLGGDWSVVEGGDISARRVLGDTTGTVVPAGYVGEVIPGTVAADSAYTSVVIKNIGSITLNKGVYRLEVLAYVTVGGGTLVNIMRRGRSSVNNTLPSGQFHGGVDTNAGADQGGSYYETITVSADSTQFFINVLLGFSVSTASHIQSNSYIRAIRIA